MDAVVGARILGEVEEMSLEETIDNVRTAIHGNSNRLTFKSTHLEDLDDLADRHFKSTQTPSLAISGRYLPLVYKIVSTLASAPHHYTVLIIDLEGSFDATRLACEEADASHVYVHRPPGPGSIDIDGEEEGIYDGNSATSAENLRALVSEAKDFMLYSDTAASSAFRRWWGTIVIGGFGAGDLLAGWKGWLRVSREQVQAFNLGTSVEESLGRRPARQKVVDAAGWAAESPWGGFIFTEGG